MVRNLENNYFLMRTKLGYLWYIFAFYLYLQVNSTWYSLKDRARSFFNRNRSSEDI